MTTSGKRILVTGTASGLGREVASLLISQGNHVAAIDRHPTSLDDVSLTGVVDITDAAAVEEFVADCVRTLGGLDGVAHCAGVFDNRFLPLAHTSRGQWDQTIAVNLTGTFIIAKSCLPALVDTAGRMVLVGSVASRYPQPGGGAYAASKAAVGALGRSIALEYAPHGVTCNVILPGYMHTGMTALLHDRPELQVRIESSVPLGRISDPTEIAEVIAFLLVARHNYLTGEEIIVDGGASLTSYVDPRDVQAMWKRKESLDVGMNEAGTSTPKGGA